MAASRSRRVTSVTALRLILEAEADASSEDDVTIRGDKSDDDEENYTDEQGDSEDSQNLNEEKSVSVNDDNTAREPQTQVSAAANQQQQRNDNRFIAKDGTQWSPEPPFMNPRGRQPSHNMVRERAGPTRQAVELALTHTEAFSCFICIFCI